MKELITELKKAVGTQLVSVTQMGPLTEDHGQAKSLTTVLIVLKDAHPDTLDLLRTPLIEARRRIRLEPILVIDSERERMLDALPLKALSFRFHGEVLHGAAPFTDLLIKRDHVRLRLEQVSRDLLMRLRHDVCLSDSTAQRLHGGVWRTVRGLARMLDGLWYLDRGDDVPPDTWHKLPAHWGLSATQLDNLSHLSAQDVAQSSPKLATDLLELLTDLVNRIDEYEV